MSEIQVGDVGEDVLALMASIQETATHNMEVIISTHMQLVQTVIIELEEAFPDLICADNPFVRMLLLALLGFFVGVVLMVFAAFAMGAWGLPALLALTIGVNILSGLLADPDRDWSLHSGSPSDGSVLGIPLNF